MAINHFETYSIILISLENINTHFVKQIHNLADVEILPIDQNFKSWLVEIKSQGTKSLKKTAVSKKQIIRGIVQLDNHAKNYDYYAILLSCPGLFITKSGKYYTTNGSITDGSKTNAFYNLIKKEEWPSSKKKIRLLAQEYYDGNYSFIIKEIKLKIKKKWSFIFGSYNNAAFDTLNGLLSLDNVPLILKKETLSLFNKNANYISFDDLRYLEKEIP